ncbi:TonB-dependent receptor [Puteibacter caeruleilacunae]|nr:TonB-dependent receptor [Puteibacter caeruleilacunae]
MKIVRLTKTGWLLMLAMFISSMTFAQVSTITGTVTDDSTGEALPGVSVIVKGTTNGTATDLDGKYSLDVPNGETVIFSFIGYKSQEIVVTQAGSINVLLKSDTEDIEEVVIVGYGVQKKKDKTGAVAKVKASDLNGGTLTDPMQAMQGKAAGVVITKQGGDPNSGFNVRVRGSAGFSSNVSPLYVVDGIPGVDPTTIAPEDIESYDILKDASSTAIYGSRGSNGVIFITTKSGKSGKTKVEYNAYVAVDNVAKELDLLSADEYRSFAQENGINITDGGASTDWQDEIFRTGLTHNNNLALTGGNEQFYYRGSVTHSNFEGVIYGSKKERTIGRLDLTQKALDDKLTFNMGVSATIENNNYIKYEGNGGADVLFQAFQRNPTLPVYNEDGTFHEDESGLFNYNNPIAIIESLDNKREAKRLLGTFSADYEVFKGLNAKVTLGYIRDDEEKTYFEPAGSKYNKKGYGNREYKNNETKSLEAVLTFKKLFNEVHNVGAVAGYSYQEFNYDGFKAQGREPLSNQIGANNLEVFNNIVLGDISSYRGSNKLIGFFGRATYDYMSKYYVTATLRRDGSSKFGDNNEWGWFPSASVGWSLSEEDFIKDNFQFIDMLKVRAGWGVSGNQDFANYKDIAIVGYNGAGVDPNTGEPIVTMDYKTNANPELKWEENHEWNFGLDFGILRNRISGSVEYYIKDTKDLLAPYKVPTPPYNHDVIFANNGEVKNRGLEVTLNGYPIRQKNFEWNTTLTFSTNENEVKSLDTGGEFDIKFKDVGYISGPGLVGVPSQRIMAGHSLGTFYGLEYAGIDDNGLWLIKGNDGKTYRAQEIDVTDSKYTKVIGNALPDFELGWSNRFNYKNWDLNFAFRAVVGHDVLNVSRLVFGNPSQLKGGVNGLQEAAKFAEYVQQGGVYSDFYLEDGSFIKLDNLNVGYTFKTDGWKMIDKLRVYASANNIFTLTNYDGIDPEVNFDGGDKDKGEVHFGIDQYNIYPKTRTITLGVNLTF